MKALRPNLRGLVLLTTLALACGSRTELTASTTGPSGVTDGATGNRGLLLFGGEDCNTADDLNDTWIWNGSTWSRLDVRGPAARDSATAAQSAQGYPLLFGGSPNLGAPLGDTWLWRDQAWVAATGTGPPPREDSAMAALNGTLVMFGGDDYEVIPGCHSHDYRVLDDTWLWDGAAWQDPMPAISPPARQSHSMAALRDSVVLFGGTLAHYTPEGGIDEDADADDTWIWNGRSWTRQLVNGPSRRDSAGMAALNGVVVLFGGETTGLAPLGDTWLWDGSSWTRLDVKGPSARAPAAMATFNGTVVLFGGFTGFARGCGGGGCECASDTWTWDGNQWARLDVPGPTARLGPTMVAFGPSE
jgi:hypothetical protein